MDDSAADFDADGLSNLEEYQNNTDPTNFDTDGDLLPDGWEIDYGLDPTVHNAADNDTDSDGVSDFDEWVYGGNPNSGDTDGDGIGDGVEISNGNSPSGGSDDNDEPQVVDVEFSVGDHSGSNSERWILLIKGTDPEIDDKEIKFASRDFGEVDVRTFKLKQGGTYQFSLQHIATNNTNGDREPDYDWTAKVGEESGAYGSFIVGAAAWLIDNTQGLLGQFHGNEVNTAAGRVATLLPIQVKEISFDGAEYYELKNDQNSVTYSAPHWLDEDGNGAPTDTANGEKIIP